MADDKRPSRKHDFHHDVHHLQVIGSSLRDVDAVVHRAQRGEFIYGVLGLFLGLACIIGGSILALRGVIGATSWTARVLGLSSEISDAPPGVMLFIVGIFLVWITKPRTKLRDIHPYDRK